MDSPEAGSQAPMWSPGTLFQQPAWCLQESRGLEWANYELAIFYGCIRDLCLTARSLVANMLEHGPTPSQHIAGCSRGLIFREDYQLPQGEAEQQILLPSALSEPLPRRTGGACFR